MFKKIMILTGKMVSLIIGYFIILQISGAISGLAEIFKLTKKQEIVAGIGFLFVAFFYSGLSLYICKRSNWFGLKLLFAVFVLHFGITVFLTQIESFIFLDLLVKVFPVGALPYIVLDSTISAILFSLLVVTVSWKWKKSGNKIKQYRLKMRRIEWNIKFVLLGIIYIFIYFLFGAFVMIPIAGMEAFNNYYAGLVIPSWLFILQFFRGIIWVLIALPLILMFKGNKHETALAVGLSFSILMGINLLIPLPFMPDRIRIAHFIELMTSNFTYGIIVAYVMMKTFLKKPVQEIAPERQEEAEMYGED